MTGLAWLFLALSAVAAVVDWWAIARSNRRVEYIAKPATLVGLILVALTLEPDVDAMRAWFVAALVLSLIGDVFLMLPRDLFLPGLGSFLLAHVAYVIGFAAAGLDTDTLLIVAPLVAVAIVLYAGYLIRNMKGKPARHARAGGSVCADHRLDDRVRTGERFRRGRARGAAVRHL